ncbi:MAG: peptide chain release factor N(5)-glutamine methyltransferase [Planctomycetes bacterium]|nr:peptide chain release factor N(5)-glutamine methyltransferase [Planctomycetota bacterium]
MSTATEKVWTLGELLDWTAKHLASKPHIETPRLDAEVLLAHAADCKRIDLYGIRHGETASPEVRQQFRDMIRRRLEGCPVAYLVGRKEFYGLEFKVGPAVLIPRPDTEHVVMECLALTKTMDKPRIVDIGAGSGAIAIAIAKNHATAEITAIDKSADALAVAKENAAKHGVADRVRFLHGDLFTPIEPAAQARESASSLACAAGSGFHFIVSNPPYIADDDMPKLPIGVRQYEPHQALNGGPGGFVVFDRLIAESRSRLLPGGWLIVEIGTAQEKPAREKLSAITEFELAPTVYDFSGHPRVLRARRV